MKNQNRPRQRTGNTDQLIAELARYDQENRKLTQTLDYKKKQLEIAQDKTSWLQLHYDLDLANARNIGVLIGWLAGAITFIAIWAISVFLL